MDSNIEKVMKYLDENFKNLKNVSIYTSKEEYLCKCYEINNKACNIFVKDKTYTNDIDLECLEEGYIYIVLLPYMMDIIELDTDYGKFKGLLKSFKFEYDSDFLELILIPKKNKNDRMKKQIKMKF